MLCALITLLPFSLSVPAIRPGDWPQWGGPGLDNISLETGWSPIGQEDPAWVESIGLGYSSPAIAGSRLVITGYFDGEGTPGEGVDRVTCLDAVSGELLWSHEYPATIYNNEHAGGVLSTPTIADGMVYVASRAGGVRAYALDGGSLAWEVDLVERHQVETLRYGFSSSPYIHGDQLILNAGSTLALNRETGATDWISENYDASYSTVRPIQLGETLGFVIFGGEGLIVADASDGSRMHTFAFRKGNRNVEGATAIVLGTRVFISSGYDQGGAMVDFGGDEPELLWRTRRLRTKMAGSTYFEGHFYGFDESMLKCIDESGEEQWRVRGLGHGAMSIANGHLLVGTSEGELLIAVASPEGFEEISRTAVIDGGVFWAAPVLANGRIYLRGSLGEIACLDHRGKELAVGRAAEGARDQTGQGSALPTPQALEATHLRACGLDQHEVPGLLMTGKLYSKALGLDDVSAEWQLNANGQWHTRVGLPPSMEGFIEVCYDGEAAWELSPFGGPKLLRAEQLAELASLGGPRALLDPLPTGLPASAVSLESYRGVPCYRVDIPLAEGGARQVYFEMSTGRLFGRSALTESTVIFGDWRDVQGLSLPFGRTEFDSESGEERRWMFSKVELHAAPEGTFVRPDAVNELLNPAEAMVEEVVDEPAVVDEKAQQIAQREADFTALLTGSKLVGFFSLNGKPESGQQEDSYTITSVTKDVGDQWIFKAKVEYGGRSIPIQLKLPVLWAGDTPVISVTDMGFPMLGKYSARVLFDGDQYAGVWSGKDYGGQMWGRVVRDESAAKVPTKDAKQAINWPSFRGPDASGVADGYDVPREWDVEEGEHVLWHFPFPGMAHSSPVIWGDRLFVTTAIRKDGDEQELKVGLYGSIAPVQDDSEFSFELHCLDKKTGDPLWSRVCWEGVPSVKRHPKGSHAVPSPATDGKRVLAFFGGEGLYCYNLDGEPMWERDLGPMDSGYYMIPDAQWGFGSSPVLHDDLAIIQCDIQTGSFIAALDAQSGEDRWRTDRDEVPTWGTPTILVGESGTQVICNGYKHTGGYDLQTGEELWSLEGGGDIPVPTPIVSKDLILITSAHGRMAPIYAIDANVRGVIENNHEDEPQMAWSVPRRGNYMQTPLAYGDVVYFCSDAGIITAYDTLSGEELQKERIGMGRTGFTSSPVAANGYLYYASEEGEVHVVRASDLEVVAVNPLGEECMSTPAISEGVLYYRTRSNLLAIGF